MGEEGNFIDCLVRSHSFARFLEDHSSKLYSHGPDPQISTDSNNISIIIIITTITTHTFTHSQSLIHNRLVTITHSQSLIHNHSFTITHSQSLIHNHSFTHSHDRQ